jgi:parvulin-like peptidyl-prolyl isomerase
MHDGTHFYRLDGRRTGTNEVVRASHILIGSGNNKDSAKAVAQNLHKRVNTTNFASLAMENSTCGSAPQGGDLGYFGKGNMVAEFEKAAFGTRVGSIVGPIETQFGYHIIYVTDKKSDELKYSDIVFQILTSNTTKNQIKRDALSAMKQVEDGANIDTLAAKLEIICQETPFMTRERPFFGSMFLTNKIFESKLNDVLEPREIYKGNQVILVQVSGVRKAGNASFEDDSARIRQKVMKLKQLDLAKQRADEIYNLIKNNPTMDGISHLPYDLAVGTANNIRNNGAIPGHQSDFTATMRVFELPTGQINEPVRSENGYYIFEIKRRVIPTETEAKDAIDINRQQYARSLFDN